MSSRTNPPQTIDQLVLRAAAANPGAVALVDAPNRATFTTGDPLLLTWAELNTAIDAVAAQLEDLGAAPGARVGVQLPNIVELPITILACARIGAVVVPYPVQHREHELSYGIEVTSPTVFVTGQRTDRPDQLTIITQLAQGAAAPMQVATFDQDKAANVAMLQLAPSQARAKAQGSTPNDVVSVCWTSGTTGDPKGVPRTNAMWLASASFQVSELGLTSTDNILCPFPVVNMAGIGGMLVPWAMAGAALHLHQPLDLQVFLGQIQTESITYTVAPPPLLNMLLSNEALLAQANLTSIRKISSGSAPLDPWMVEGWQARGIEIVNVFGSNEGAALLSTAASVPDPAERARFFPVPTRPGVEVKLVALGDESVISETGIPGELRFRGPTVFDGYLGSDGTEFDADGFFRTGDVFEYGGDSNPPTLLRFVDRAKDIIIRGGMNVSAAEVEGLVGAMEGVNEVAAVAFPDRDLGERVGLFVVASEQPPTLDSIVEHMRNANVASYKLPERLELVDALPRNPVGKVLKPELRARWSDQ